jgi:hypothetical protein
MKRRLIYTFAMGVIFIFSGWFVRGHASFNRDKKEYHAGNLMIAFGALVLAAEIYVSFIHKKKKVFDDDNI